MRKKLVFALAMVLAGAMSLTGCASAKNEPSGIKVMTSEGEKELAVDQTIRINLGSDPLTLDPQLNSASDGSHVINNAYEGLLREVDGEMVPGMAERYTVSEDGLVYTFYLRDALWSDGKPVSAKDFEYAWKRGADPATASEYMYLFESANILNAGEIGRGEKSADELGVKALDDKTFEVTLSVPTEYFKELCGYPTMMPVRGDYVDDDGAWAKDPNKAISNGPFVLSEYKMGDRLIYKKNPNYWNAENVTLEKIIYYMIVDESTAYIKFDAGELDINEYLPADEIPRLMAEDTSFKILPKIGTYYYAFNMNTPVLQDVRVRKAIALAVDKDQIVNEVTRAGEIAATGYMPEGITDDKGESFTEKAGDYGLSTKADPEKAKELLAEAGYPNGQGFPEIEILYNTNEGHKKIAEAVQEMLKQNLGISVKLTNQEWAVFQTTTNENKFEYLARRGWIGDYNDPQTMLEIFESTNSQNIGRYNNPEFDAEMAASRKTIGAERMAHLYKAHDILMEDMPVIPVYYYSYPIMIQNRVMDWEMTSESKMWLGNAKIIVEED